MRALFLSSDQLKYAARSAVARPTLALALMALVSSANAADWLRFRGPNGAGIAADPQTPLTWNETQNVQWKTRLPGPGTSSPIVAGARVFVTCYSGYGDGNASGDPSQLKRELVCLDRANGKILWSTTTPAAQPEDAFEGFLTEHGYASHTPVSDGERVYVFYGKGGAAAFDFNGKMLWQKSLGTNSNEKHWGSAGSPILYKDYVIINASEESHALVALDKRSGQEVWRAPGDALEYSFGTPVPVETAGRVDLAFAAPGEVWGLNPETGKLRWFAQTGLTNNVAPSVVAGDGMVFAFGGFPQLGALAVKGGGKGDVTATHIAWTTRDSSYIPTPIYYQDRLHWVSDAGFALCLDAKTGKLIYKERLPGATATGRGKPFYASPVLAHGAIYAQSRRNGLFVIAAEPQFKLIAQNRLPSDETDFNATPALSDSQIFLRSNQFLYCIGARRP